MATTYFHGQAFRLYSLPMVDPTGDPVDYSYAPTGNTNGEGAAIPDLSTVNFDDLVPFGCAKSASLSVSNNVIDVTCQGNDSYDSAGARAVIPGQKSWSMSSELLYTVVTPDADNEDATDLQGYFDAGTPVLCVLGDGQDGNNYWTGLAYIASVEVSSAPGELVSYSVTMEGTGNLTYGTFDTYTTT